MSYCSVIINVSNRKQSQRVCQAEYIIPAKVGEEQFGILVVFPQREIQDIGDNRRVNHIVKSKPIARDIVGMNSDAAAHASGAPGSFEKWGILLCHAEPMLPRELEDAIEAETEYLNKHMPVVGYERDAESGAAVAVNRERPNVEEKKIELSLAVQELRSKFESECKSLVTMAEIKKAQANLQRECQRLISEADQMWATNLPAIRQSVNELHRWACELSGQEREWCYVPQQLLDCPGCGKKVKDNILFCPFCAGDLSEGIVDLAKLHPRERKLKMYPNQIAEPVAAGGKR